MIGRKKLSTIRQDLRRALEATGEDPIDWLEKRMTTPERQGSATSVQSEVLQSPRRFLISPGKGRRRRPRPARKK